MDNLSWAIKGSPETSVGNIDQTYKIKLINFKFLFRQYLSILWYLFLICVHSWQAASVYWGNELQTMQWTSGGAGPLFHRAGQCVVKICRAAVDHWPLTWRLTVHKRNISIVKLWYHFLFFDLSLMIVGLSSWLMNILYGISSQRWNRFLLDRPALPQGKVWFATYWPRPRRKYYNSGGGLMCTWKKGKSLDKVNWG